MLQVIDVIRTWFFSGFAVTVRTGGNGMAKGGITTSRGHDRTKHDKLRNPPPVGCH